MRYITLFIIYKIIMPVFLKIFVGVKVFNKHALNKDCQFIIASNHNSHLDTMAVISSLPMKLLYKTHPVAAADYFGSSPITAFFSRLFVNAVLIKRKREEGEKSPIEIMEHLLDNGHSIIIFPEGTRGEPEKMIEFKKGIGILLHKKPHIPYLPVFMRGMGRVLPRGEKLLVPFDCYVFFGEPKKAISNDPEEIKLEVEKAVIEIAANHHQYVSIKNSIP